jgi:hypothetical protein
MPFPLRHPELVVRDRDGDAFLEDVMFSGNVARLFARLREHSPRLRAVQ